MFELNLDVLANITGIAKSELLVKLNTKAGTKGDDDNYTYDATKVGQVIDELMTAKFKTVSDAQRSRGQREKAEEFEKFILEQFKLSSKTKGTALISELVEASKSQSSDPLTAENAATNPIVKQLITDEKQKMKDAYDGEIATLKDKLSTERVKRSSTTIKSAATSILKDVIKADILGEDGSVDAKKMRYFDTIIGQNKIKLDENDKPILVDENGEQRLDDRMNPVEFTDWLKSENPFGERQESGGKSGGKPNSSSGGGNTGKHNFKSQAEYYDYMNNKSNSLEDRKAAQVEWRANNQK